MYYGGKCSGEKGRVRKVRRGGVGDYYLEEVVSGRPPVASAVIQIPHTEVHLAYVSISPCLLKCHPGNGND